MARRLLATAAAAAAAAPIPTPIGSGPRYRLDAASPAVARAAPAGRFRCLRAAPRRELAHVELFARRLVLLLPAGIGMAPPLERSGAAVTGARCFYPVRTADPTGVVEFDPRARPTLGDLFDVWGQPLSTRRLAGFRGPVRVWVGGRRRHGDPRTVRLRRHAEIVVEVGGYVPPHRLFLFPRR
ncbi:MAG TPA: hypothetical protein VFB42_11520 [Gaiellaceae bacterium]|nr:hypothetical protein [Gaiellaceae bacterium]